MSFARHTNRANIMMNDGSVRSGLAPAIIDPELGVAVRNKWWIPADAQ